MFAHPLSLVVGRVFETQERKKERKLWGLIKQTVYSPPCPCDTHYQFSMKTLLSKKNNMKSGIFIPHIHITLT